MAKGRTRAVVNEPGQNRFAQSCALVLPAIVVVHKSNRGGGKDCSPDHSRGLQRRPHTTSTDRQLATAVVTVDFFFFFSASQSSKSQNNFESPKSNGRRQQVDAV